jgi:hypothetical protein
VYRYEHCRGQVEWQVAAEIQQTFAATRAGEGMANTPFAGVETRP